MRTGLARFACVGFVTALAACGGGHASGIVPRVAADGRYEPAALSRAAASPFAPGTLPADVLADGAIAYYRLDDMRVGSLSVLTTLPPTIGYYLTGYYGTNVELGNRSLTAEQTDAAAFFPGSGASANIASVPANPAFASALRSLTVEAWIAPTDLQTAYYLPIVSYGRQVQGQAWVLQLTAQSHPDFWFKTGGGSAKLPSRANNLVGSTPLERGRTYHLVATYDGVTAKLYVDGVLDGTLAAGGPLDYDGIQPQWGLGIGGALGPNAAGAHASFAGVIDDVAIYAAALSAARVMTHYSDGVYRAPTAGASRIYVADGSGNRIVTYNTDGSPGSLTITGGVNAPTGVAVDPSGKVSVLDHVTQGPVGTVIGSEITTYDAQGAPTTPAIMLTPVFGNAYTSALAVGALGQTFVGAWNGGEYLGQIAGFDPAGNLTGINFTVANNGVQGLAVDAVGNYVVGYLAYLGDCTVVGYGIYDNRPPLSIDIPSPDCDAGVAVDAAGKLYVSESTTVRTFNPDGTRANPTITNGLSVPGAVAVDALGKIYVMNRGNHTITAYHPDGTRTTPTITLPFVPSAIAVR